MHSRFSDRGKREAEFLTEFLVRCPRCDKQAIVRSDGVPWTVKQAKLTCVSCGHSDRWTVGPAKRAPKRIPGALTRDPFFGCMLWFVADVKGDVFWAYNREHLQFIRDYVAATLRVREPYRNGSMASRLPAFLTVKKNRAAVLREIEKMSSW